jgi:hypothetical protein
LTTPADGPNMRGFMKTDEGPTPPRDDLESKVKEWCGCAEKCAREEPLQCLSLAFVIGLIASVLPIGRLVGLVVQLAFSLLRPVLVLLGLMKVFEELDKRREK